MVLAAPWVTRAVVAWPTAGCWWPCSAPASFARRVADLEHTRALAADDAAAQLRRVERDLHDGAQIRLATLAMHLGRARETLAIPGAADVARPASWSTPPTGTPSRPWASCATWPGASTRRPSTAASTTPWPPWPRPAVLVELACDLPERLDPAIETIAYYCAAELLANAAKHSHAGQVTVQADGRRGRLALRVGDDGVGGADPLRGLAGLAQRVSTVDGRLRIASPRGGPTLISVHLPLRT